MKSMEEGNKFARSGLLRWSPDHHKASAAFVDAARKFQALGNEYTEHQAKAHEKAAQSFEELNSLNTSAKHFVAASQAYSKCSRSDRALECGIRAKELYFANGQIDMAANQLEKVAKSVEDGHPEEAMQFYREALDLYLENDKEALSHDLFKSAIAFACRIENFDQAIKILRKHNQVLLRADKPLRLCKNCLAIVIILLYQKRDRDASDSLTSFPEPFYNSEEHRIAEELITAFEEIDAEKLEVAKTKPSIRLIETSVARLIRKLEIDASAKPFFEKKKEEDEVDLC